MPTVENADGTHKRLARYLQRLREHRTQLAAIADPAQRRSFALPLAQIMIADLGAAMKPPCKDWNDVLANPTAVGGELCDVSNDEFQSLVRDYAGFFNELVRLTAHATDGADPDNFTSLSNFLAEPDVPVNWIVDGFAPAGGLSLIVAKPKAGKSTLARYIAVCVARGVPCLGRATSQGPVLYVSIEERRRDVRDHFKRLTAGCPELPIHVHVGQVAGTPAKATREGIRAHRVAWLAREIERHRPVLVVVDTWGKFLNVKDNNDYAEGLEAAQPIVDLARNTDAHLGFTHHAKKSEAELIDSVLGSTAIAASVDTILLIRRLPDKIRTLASNQRVGEDLDESVVLLDKTAGTLAMPGTLDAVRRGHAIDAVVRVVRAAHPTPLGERDICERAGMQRAVTLAALRDAVMDALLSRSGEGKRGKPFRWSMFENGEREGINKTKESENGENGGMDCSPAFVNSVPGSQNQREPGEEG
jgi:hypothetical protein